MFTIQQLGVSVRDSYGSCRKHLLREISFRLPAGHFAAIVGPSGCGKSTLVKALLGLHRPDEGRVFVEGLDLQAHLPYLLPEIGYVPQFSIAHEELTVVEALDFAARLRLPGNWSARHRSERLVEVLEEVEMRQTLHTRVGFLSGGQKRRLSLAMELLRNPPILIMDEVTSGLDAHSEKKFMELFARLAHQYGKTVICVTHNVEHLSLCDSILVLREGRLAFHGDLPALRERFGVESAFGLYARLEEMNEAELETPGIPEVTEGRSMEFAPLPSPVSQWWTLLSRQMLLFFRNPTQVILQAVLILGFPFLVVVFAYDGLPQVTSMSLTLSRDIFQDMQEQIQYARSSIRIATLASGLVMFQVILLTLMGSNNGAREIVKERPIYEKERLAGVSPLAYLCSKTVFVCLLSLIQAGVMLALVRYYCRFPGDWMVQYCLLALATAAMSMTCLMFSAFFRSTEQSSLVSIYLVGLQLPLSGAVLALPAWLLIFTQPLIDAYWAWSGFIRTFTQDRVYDVIAANTKTSLASPETALLVLGLHFVFCFIAAYVCVKKVQSPS
ncbi:MAG: ABC transporter ATP-binding protein/permease [Verrucomicrobiae bacterium]|nr:ABC transporter ATP-binding protein/permease [Verrucomicrobiae bacterium]